MDDFVPKSTDIFKYFYDEQTEATESLLQEKLQRRCLTKYSSLETIQKPLCYPYFRNPSKYETFTLL